MLSSCDGAECAGNCSPPLLHGIAGYKTMSIAKRNTVCTITINVRVILVGKHCFIASVILVWRAISVKGILVLCETRGRTEITRTLWTCEGIDTTPRKRCHSRWKKRVEGCDADGRGKRLAICKGSEPQQSIIVTVSVKSFALLVHLLHCSPLLWLVLLVRHAQR